MSRRDVVRLGAMTALASVLAPRIVWAASRESRRLRLVNTHTGERVDACYFDGGRLVPDALAAIDHVLRDFRTNEIHPIDAGVLDIACALATAVGHPAGEIEIISGYRSRATNDMLRATRSGIATHSLHCEGRAMDLRLRPVATTILRDAALEMRRGGVGYYASLDFVHVDDGRVRRW